MPSNTYFSVGKDVPRVILNEFIGVGFETMHCRFTLLVSAKKFFSLLSANALMGKAHTAIVKTRSIAIIFFFICVSPL